MWLFIWIKMYKYIVFDFDGTLVDSRAAFLSLYNEIAGERGYLPMTPENIGQLRDMSIAERCKFLQVPMYKLPFLVAEALQKYKHIIPTLRFNEGMKEFLGELTAKDVPYALLSSNSKANIQEFFALHGIIVEDIYTSGKIFSKDKMLKRFLKDKKLQPSEILYVGDESRDIIACKKAGVKIAWVSWGYDAEAGVLQHSPDYIAHHPSQLMEILSKG